MADPEFLREGDCYFHMNYSDNDLFIPMIETYIYVKSGVDENNEKYWLFSDADSYRDKSVESQYLGIVEENLYSMLTISELKIKLQGLEHLHPLSGVQPTTKVGLTDKNREFIKTQLKAISPPEVKDSVTITTSYRDKGVSISCENRLINLLIFVDCREYPEEERAVRGIISEHGVTPVEDYLAQHERVRILSYSIDDSALAENIICGLFIEAYGIYEHEKLRAV